jgi:hypothetical protein
VTITEEARHQLYRRLEEVLGPAEAAIMMEHLPPVGWADVATKRDLEHLAAATTRDVEHLAAATKRDIDHLAAATKRDLDHLELRVEALLHRELRAQTFRMMAGFTGLAAVVVAAVRL